PRPLADEAAELVERGLADAVLVTGAGTGRPVRPADLDTVLQAVKVPVYAASGTSEASLAALSRAHGVIVGSCLRHGGRAGQPIAGGRARAFAAHFRKIWGCPAGWFLAGGPSVRCNPRRPASGSPASRAPSTATARSSSSRSPPSPCAWCGTSGSTRPPS